MRLVAVVALTLLLHNQPPDHTVASPVNKQDSQAAVVEKPQIETTTATPIEPVTPQIEVQTAVVTQPPPEVSQPEPKPEPSNREIGQEMAATKGWSGSQWLCLEKLWTNESNWRTEVPNRQGSGAYGIPQAVPASKMASHGADYRSNPRTQIAWGLDYISRSYKTPCGALSFWEARVPINGKDVGNWY